MNCNLSIFNYGQHRISNSEFWVEHWTRTINGHHHYLLSYNSSQESIHQHYLRFFQNMVLLESDGKSIDQASVIHISGHRLSFEYVAIPKSSLLSDRKFENCHRDVKKKMADRGHLVKSLHAGFLALAAWDFMIGGVHHGSGLSFVRLMFAFNVLWQRTNVSELCQNNKKSYICSHFTLHFCRPQIPNVSKFYPALL